MLPWDHLRVCGADPRFKDADSVALGSPPRVRSRRITPTTTGLSRGITSACAEQTSNDPPYTHSKQDHLRVCGADDLLSILEYVHRGSPPRVRSRPYARNQ